MRENERKLRNLNGHICRLLSRSAVSGRMSGQKSERKNLFFSVGRRINIALCLTDRRTETVDDFVLDRSITSRKYDRQAPANQIELFVVLCPFPRSLPSTGLTR